MLYAKHILQHGNILSCAKISLLIAIRCCILIINCSKVVYHRVQHFSVDIHTLLYANRILQESNLLLCDYISLLQAICCHMLTIYCSKLIVYRVLVFSYCKRFVATCYYFSVDSHILSFACRKLQQGNPSNIVLIFPRRKPYVVVCKSYAAARLSLIVCLYVSAARHTLFMQIMYYSKVIFYCVLIFSCC